MTAQRVVGEVVRRGTAGAVDFVADGSSRAREFAGRFLLGYSGNTEAAYRRDLTEWFNWCALDGVDPLDVERAHVDGWARWLREEQGLKPSSVARRLSTISGYYKYAVGDGVVARSPVLLRRPKVGEDSPRLGLDRDETRRLLAAAQASGPRDWLIVCLLLYDGLRVSEVCGADHEHLMVIRGQQVLKVTRKGGRLEDVVLPAPTLAALAVYLELRGEHPGALFLNAAGRRLRRQNAAWIVGQVSEAAGLPRIGPHDLRHTAVTNLLEAGVPLHEAQDFAGHVDPRTTQRYNRARRRLEHHPAHRLAAYLSG